jgi:iron complex transport system substrate-binding protein
MKPAASARKSALAVFRPALRPLKNMIGAVFALFGLAGHAIAAPNPHRIVSLKICTDELLMDLAPTSHIASISYLSREKAALRLWPQAAQIPVNHNTPEEVLALKPDLILTDPYISDAMRGLLAKSGARIVEVPDAENFDQIRAVTRQVGAAVGEPKRAESLIAQMDATLKDAAAHRPATPSKVIGWGGGGFLPGKQSLFDAVLAASGARNIAARDYADVEGLVAARPDVLAYGDDYIDAPSLRDNQNDHPLLLKFFAHRRVVYPSALLDCGVPQTAEAVRTLQSALANAMRRPGGVP